MLDYVLHIINRIGNYTAQLDRTQWILVMVGVLVCGLFLLRGFGSRTTY